MRLGILLSHFPDIMSSLAKWDRQQWPPLYCVFSVYRLNLNFAHLITSVWPSLCLSGPISQTQTSYSSKHALLFLTSGLLAMLFLLFWMCFPNCPATDWKTPIDHSDLSQYSLLPGAFPDSCRILWAWFLCTLPSQDLFPSSHSLFWRQSFSCFYFDYWRSSLKYN